MPAASETAAYPPLAGQPASMNFQCVFPIATGGLPIYPQGTAVPTGVFPAPTGSINGTPSGVPLYYRSSGNAYLRKEPASTGLYSLIFAPAPNGTVRAWMEFVATSFGLVRAVEPVKRDIGTGYVQLQCYSASGTKVDLVNGDALGVEYTAFAKGTASGNP